MADVKRIRVAAIQIKSKLGQPEENIRHAIPYIEQAAKENAQLVALPEMCISGYTLARQDWRNSEPIGGSSERWLSETARRLGIHLCTDWSSSMEKISTIHTSLPIRKARLSVA